MGDRAPHAGTQEKGVMPERGLRLPSEDADGGVTKKEKTIMEKNEQKACGCGEQKCGTREAKSGCGCGDSCQCGPSCACATTAQKR